MKLFIHIALCSFFAASSLVAKPIQKKTDHIVKGIPFTITNTGTIPVDLQLDLRIDYYYSHTIHTTFLPASAINKRVTINPQETVSIHIPLPPQLHEPYNGIKQLLRNDAYEQTDTIMRGVIGYADEPRKFFRIKASLQNKKSYSFTINPS